MAISTRVDDIANTKNALEEIKAIFIMKVIDRYIIAEVLTPFIQCLVVLTFIMLLNQIMQVTEMAINRGLGLFFIFRLFGLVIPPLFVFVLPVSILVASVASFARLSCDSEFIAMQASGVSLFRMAVPVLVFAMIVTCLDFYISVSLKPWSGTSLKKMGQEILQNTQKANIPLDEGTFNILSKDLMIYVEKMPSYVDLDGVFISDTRDPATPMIAFAKSGRIITSSEDGFFGLRLKEGTIQSSSRQDKTERIVFSDYEFKVNMGEIFGGEDKSTAPDPVELQAMLKSEKNPDRKKRVLRSLQAHHKNFIYPVLCLVFSVLGIPLGIVNRRSGRMGGFAVAVFGVIVFYILDAIAASIVSAGIVSPLAGAVMPVLVIGIFTIFFFKSRAMA